LIEQAETLHAIAGMAVARMEFAGTDRSRDHHSRGAAAWLVVARRYAAFWGEPRAGRSASHAGRRRARASLADGLECPILSAVRVFSASIESFLDRLAVLAKRILRDDFGVSVGRSRFSTADGWSWPILLVAIDDRERLGYFDPSDGTIGIHKRLMYTAKDRVLENLLRHELAHYFTFIEHHGSGSDDLPHGPQFQRVCDTYGLGPEVRRASIDVRAENEAIEGELASEAVIAKFQRLMSLAESDNEHEAALAVLRANELMVRHNLEAAARGAGSGEIEYCVKLVLPYRRSNPRTTAIAEILAEFLVFPVHGSEGLEVTGTRANVEHAEYIAGYLDRALAAAWKRARKDNPGRRLREKPFMEAAAESYLVKLKRAKAKLPDADQDALVVLTEQLEWAGHGIYAGGLARTTSRYRGCAVSSSHGARAGAELEIRRGLSGSGVRKLLQG
jgi:hypothetical protein